MSKTCKICVTLLAAALALSVVLNVVLVWQRQTLEGGYERLERHAENALRECVRVVRSELEQMHADAEGAMSGGSAYIAEQFGSPGQYARSVTASLDALSANMQHQANLTSALEAAESWILATIPTTAIKNMQRFFEDYECAGDAEYGGIEDKLAAYNEFLELTIAVYSPAEESRSPETSAGILSNLSEYRASYDDIAQAFAR